MGEYFTDVDSDIAESISIDSADFDRAFANAVEHVSKIPNDHWVTEVYFGLDAKGKPYYSWNVNYSRIWYADNSLGTANHQTLDRVFLLIRAFRSMFIPKVLESRDNP